MTEDTIPKEAHLKRLKAKQDALDQLGEELTSARARVAELTAAAADKPDYAKLERRYSKLQEQHDQTVAKFGEYKATTTTERAMLAVGVTDAEDQELIRWRYGRLDTTSRPALDAWLGEDGAGRQDRHLAALFKSPDPPAQTPAQTPAPARRPNPLPQTAGRAQAPAAPPKALTREAILSMSAAERIKPENREAIWNALQG